MDKKLAAERLHRDVVRLQDAKLARKRAPRALRSPEFKVEAHADAIKAVEEGRLTISPDGSIVPVLVEPLDSDSSVGHVEPFDMKELETIGARIAVYRAAGFEMGRVPGAVKWRARALASLLDVVGGSNEAPLAFIEAANKAIEAWLDSRGQSAEPSTAAQKKKPKR